MSYFNPFSMQDYISIYGYWLYDAGGEASKLFFNLMDPGVYPFEIDSETRSEMYQSINWLRQRCRNDFMIIKGWTEQDNAHFISLISLVRKAAAKTFLFPNHLFFPYVDPNTLFGSYCYNLRKDPDRSKYIYFFNIALLVIFANKSLYDAARYACVDSRNILIWISIFLTWGILPFITEFKPRSEKECRSIINSHIAEGRTVQFTCVVYKIFTRNKFRNMRRRYHPLRPLSYSSLVERGGSGPPPYT